jgi:uncharacterized protein YlxW (UPF0749 family)
VRIVRPPRPPLGVVLALTAMAFLASLAFRSEPANPENRLPRRYRLADLIQRQQQVTDDLQRQVSALRAEVDAEREAASRRSGGAADTQRRIEELSAVAGMTPLRGPGVVVTLDDSSLDEPPEGATVNDLVIHSQDVQAVVNALWRSGAEAIAINGQRLVGTSAVLCVGNTLLLNGTVHSPPYVVSAIGASRDRFDADRLVRRLKSASASFGIRVNVSRSTAIEVPGYSGATKLTFARPVS